MHIKYIKTINFLTATIDKNASYVWKSIHTARQYCKGLIDRKIANGENIDISFDSWLNGSSLIDKFGWNSMEINGGCSRKVSILMSGINGNIILFMFLHKYIIQYTTLLSTIKCIRIFGFGFLTTVVNLA